ncbi:MAG: serine/threonine-protein kinase, partial [Planctomycetota bacterium]
MRDQNPTGKHSDGTMTTSGDFLRQETLVETMRMLPGGSSRDSDGQDRNTTTEPAPAFVAAPTALSASATTRRYQSTEQIGRGGGGVVFRVEDQLLQRPVACKILPQAKAGEASKVRRFLREARLTARLSHPGIIPVLDAGEDASGRPWYHMRLANGADLAKLIAEAESGQLPEAISSTGKCVHIMLQVCEALAYAHAEGVVHQDIKPGNIILGEYGEVLLLDWGTALDRHEHDSNVGLVGTPAYMSPEQARREGADERSDVYCLCASLYHLLTLRLPTWHARAHEFWRCKRDGIIALEPLQRCPRVDELLAGIIRQGLAADPEQRFADAGQLREALRRWQDHRASLDSCARADAALAELALASPDRAFRRVIERYRLALEQWPDNPHAVDGLQQACALHVQAAPGRNALDLAASILSEAPRPLPDLAAAIATRQRQLWRRQGLIAVVTVMTVVSCLVLAGLLYRQSQLRDRPWQVRQSLDLSEATSQDRFIKTLGTSLQRADLAPDRAPDGLHLEPNASYWLDLGNLRGDLRCTISFSWPEQVDGFEVALKARRQERMQMVHFPAGYGVQVGGYNGLIGFSQVAAFASKPQPAASFHMPLQAGRHYQLRLSVEQARLRLQMDGQEVLDYDALIPVEGPDSGWLFLRGWAGVQIHAITLEQRQLAQYSSPLLSGDALYQRGHFQAAGDEYLRVAEEQGDSALAF